MHCGLQPPDSLRTPHPRLTAASPPLTHCGLPTSDAAFDCLIPFRLKPSVTEGVVHCAKGTMPKWDLSPQTKVGLVSTDQNGTCLHRPKWDLSSQTKSGLVSTDQSGTCLHRPKWDLSPQTKMGLVSTDQSGTCHQRPKWDLSPQTKVGLVSTDQSGTFLDRPKWDLSPQTTSQRAGSVSTRQVHPFEATTDARCR